MPSAKNIVDWYVAGNYDLIVSAINGLSTNGLVEFVNSNIGSYMDVTFLKGVLAGCEKKSLKRSFCLKAIFKESVNILSNTAMESTYCTDMICVLNHEVVNLSREAIVEVVAIILEKISNMQIGQGHCMKVLAKLLEAAQQHRTMPNEKTQEVILGTIYKRDIVAEICSMNWSNDTIFHLLEMFKDIPLDKQEVDLIISKLVNQMQKMTSQTLPPLIYQMISFATMYKKVETVLNAILLHFNKLDIDLSSDELSFQSGAVDSNSMDPSSNNANLKSIEGTVLLYVSNTLGQNQSLGKGLLKLIKAAKESVSPQNVTEFFLALSLTLSQDGRFQDETLHLLRQLVLKCFQQTHKIKYSKWLNEHCLELTDISKLLFSLVKSCHFGWDNIISSLVDLGFSLMSHYGPKPAPFNKSFNEEIKKQNNPQQEACDLGSHLLAQTFKLHEISRKDILSQIINRIQISVTTPGYLYIDLLKAIVKRYPQLLLQSVSQINNLLGDLPRMHEFNAKRLLNAILPLIRISASVRASTMLVLRKALTSRDKGPRCTAVHGFLLILKSFPMSESTSLSQVSSLSSQSFFSTASTQTQSCVSSSQRNNPRNNEVMCLEIFQVLRRCLSQQSSVRSQLYTGILCSINSNKLLSNIITGHLLKQIRIYFEADEEMIPALKLSSCFSSPSSDSCVLQEPLPTLLTTCYMCSQIIDEVEFDNSQQNDDISVIFDSLTTRICKTDMTEYGLEKDANFQSGSKTGQRNISTLTLLLANYEVLMQYNASDGDHLSDKKAEKILNIFERFKKTYEFALGLKVNELNEKFLGRNRLDSLSFNGISNLAQGLVEGQDSGFVQLANDVDYLEYFFRLLSDAVSAALEKGRISGPGSGDKDNDLNDLTRAIVACQSFIFNETDDQSLIMLHCVVTFHASIQFVNTWHKSRLEEFFSKLSENNFGSEGETNEPISIFTKRFQRLLSDRFFSAEKLRTTGNKILKEILSLLDTLFTMSCDRGSEELRIQCVDWWSKTCVEKCLDDVIASKLLLLSHLKSSVTTSNRPEICIRDICIDLRIVLGSNEEDDCSESPPTYNLVTVDNASYVIEAVANFTEILTSECEWLLQHFKSRLMAQISGGEGDDDDESLHEARRKAEGSVCGKICTIAVGLVELAFCACRSSSNVDNILHTFCHFFAFLTNLSKYYQWLYAQNLGSVPTRFEKLCDFIGSQLMKPIYGFIMYAETAQTERIESVRSKRNSKKGKKKANGSDTIVSTTGKAKILREMKGIARLVYTIEQHEHHLILLGRKSKIDFMRFHHHTTSRDFRIRSEVLHVIMAEQEALGEKGSQQVGEDEASTDVEQGEPASKRPHI